MGRAGGGCPRRRGAAHERRALARQFPLLRHARHCGERCFLVGGGRWCCGVGPQVVPRSGETSVEESGARFSRYVRDGVIDGNVVAADLLDHVRREVDRFRAAGVVPRLALVRVGDDPASAVYVRRKVKDCARCGIDSEHVHLPADATQEAVLATIDDLQSRDDVDGILVQLPLPAGLDEVQVLESVDPARDVDGFHPNNLGRLLFRRALLEPCTPSGVMHMLSQVGVCPRGKEAVVVGRSRIVGRPMAQMLTRADATVTLCHRHTPDLEGHVRRAELLVVATGVPGLVRGEWVREGAVVVDVGINRNPEGRLVGDVDFARARERAALITPVPGGVGPLTVAMLLWNTLSACWARRLCTLAPPQLPHP